MSKKIEEAVDALLNEQAPKVWILRAVFVRFGGMMTQYAATSVEELKQVAALSQDEGLEWAEAEGISDDEIDRRQLVLGMSQDPKGISSAKRGTSYGFVDDDYVLVIAPTKKDAKSKMKDILYKEQFEND